MPRSRESLQASTCTCNLFRACACAHACIRYKAILIRTGASQASLLVPAVLNAVQIQIFGLVIILKSQQVAADCNWILFGVRFGVLVVGFRSGV